MTLKEIIIVCVMLTVAVPLSTFVVIKTINKLTRPPVNTLVRPGDIELQDVIEPIQHISARDIDLSSLPQYPQAMVNPYHIPIRWDYPPRYSQLTNNLINSPLESESWYYILWLIILILIIIIIFKNRVLIGSLMNSSGTMSILIPFSSLKNDFRDSFNWKIESGHKKSTISYLKIQSLTKDIIELLDSLKNNENYSMSLSFIPSYKIWKENKEKIQHHFIDDPIIVNKESDPILISQFIIDRLDDKSLFITNWLFKDSSINSMDPYILTVTVAIKVKI